MFDGRFYQRGKPVPLVFAHQRRTAPTVGIGVGRCDLLASSRAMNNPGSELENPGGELRLYLAVDQSLLDRAAALARGDRFSVDEIARGAFDIGVFVYVEEVDAGHLFHYPLAET